VRLSPPRHPLAPKRVLVHAKITLGVVKKALSLVAFSDLDFMTTNDKVIREALKSHLKDLHAGDFKLRIVEELGVEHGAARMDVAVINGVLHGYEIKSDRDTLLRLPEQMEIYNGVFDRITLVVGKSHLRDAINAIPDWWGILIAKINDNDSVIFNEIRKARMNVKKNSLSVAKLLWRDEALEILEEAGVANGFRSKPRSLIYEKLSAVIEQEVLEGKVRDALCFREAWRSGAPLALGDG
jgi:hypothetical protein